MQLDHSPQNGHHFDSKDQAHSIDLQIKVLRRALARIQELQGEYPLKHTQSRVTPLWGRD